MYTEIFLSRNMNPCLCGISYVCGLKGPRYPQILIHRTCTFIAYYLNGLTWWRTHITTVSYNCLTSTLETGIPVCNLIIPLKCICTDSRRKIEQYPIKKVNYVKA